MLKINIWGKFPTQKSNLLKNSVKNFQKNFKI